VELAATERWEFLPLSNFGGKKKFESKIANKFLISIALWNVERHKKKT